MAIRGRRSLCAAAALALVTCRSPSGPPPPPAASERAVVTALPSSAPAMSAPAVSEPAVSEPSSLPAKTLPPLLASKFETLVVPGFRDAVVSVPVGAREPRAIALALHGNFDRPEWQCDVWRRITQGQVFVLCPRGVPRRDVPRELDRWEWSTLAKTRAELVAALVALRSRYAAYVEDGSIVFTGFSLGAILGASLIADDELNVGAAVLIEGGYRGWSPAKAKALKPRLAWLLFGCGQTDCRNAYRYQLAGLFERAGIPARMVADIKAGHTYDDPIAALVQAEWPALSRALETK